MRPAATTACPGLRFSIVVNNYNYARYLPQALDNAIAQMREGDELIVVDDGSTDESLEVLDRYQQAHNIRVIAQENQGQMSAVRVGINAARGDVVLLLDSDDYYLEGYLQRLRAIYSEHPDVSFVYCNAEVEGASDAQASRIRAMLDRMALVPGRVGTSRWAALLFHEFVGTTTSGLSMQRSLATSVLELPRQVDSTGRLPAAFARFLGISKHDGEVFGLSADGVIVRYASILNAQKFYDDRPGYLYRVHQNNRYANATAFGRWYLRRQRWQKFRQLPGNFFRSRTRPTANELHEEISGRAFGIRKRRQMTIRARYCLAILFSEGTPGEKFRAFRTALGYPGAYSPG